MFGKVKLGIFGGTFNPIHFGHLRVAEEVRELAGLDRIIFIPSGNPPLKAEDIASAQDRFEMTRTAIRENPGFDALDIECRSRKKSYTVTTLARLSDIYPGDDLFFVLGIDAFLDIPNWFRPDLLVSLVNFIVLSRPGSRFADLAASPYFSLAKGVLRNLESQRLKLHATPLISGRTAMLLNVSPVSISSTDIRSRIKQGKSVKYLLPAEVESYIISHKLYASTKTKDRAVKRECR